MARDYAARNNGNRPSGNRRPSGKGKSGGGMPGWVLGLAGLSLGLVVAAFVYVSRPTQAPLRGTSAANDIPDERRPRDRQGDEAQGQSPRDAEPGDTAGGKSRPTVPARPGAKPPADEARVAIPPKEKSRFTFYELLPSQEVLVPSQPAAKLSAVPSAPPPATPSAGTPSPPTPGATAMPVAPTGPATEVPGSFIIQVASYRSQPEAEKQKAALALMGIESRVEKVTIDNRDTYYRVRVGPLRDEGRARDTLAQLESSGYSAMMVKVK